MVDVFLSAPLAPFSLALALLAGLLALELVLALVGGSILGAGAEAPDLDAPDLDAPDLDTPDIDTPETGAAATPSAAASALGLGRAPFLIWLAALLLGFGASGLAIQTLATATLTAPLPALAAVPLALLPALASARGLTGMLSRLVPGTETQSVSESHLGRREGLVTQGTAARGRPAEVRVTDRHGNTHYLRAEPMQDDATIEQGRRVLVLRDRRARAWRLIALD